MVAYAVRQEINQNARFAHFLEQSREHRRSNRLGWDTMLKSPLTRFQRYILLLQTVLKYSDPMEPKHGVDELVQLIDEMRATMAQLDVALRQGESKVEIDSRRKGEIDFSAF